MSPTISAIIGLLGLIFAKNPTVEELLPIIEQGGTALANAKAGTAFSITFPESIDGKAGTSTLSWTPSA
jgi:hypothetical protein